METHNNVKIKNMTYMGAKVRTWINKGVVVYRAGSVVTYKVDSGVTYSEEVDSGESCLLPKTFTPQKSGWTFVGWREDSAAQGSVLSQKVMGDSPVTLYAVFAQTITCTFVSGNTQYAYGNRYYNCGNVTNAVITVPAGTNWSGWIWRGWSAVGDTSANANAVYANGQTITGLTNNSTFYGLAYQNITLSYNANGGSGTTAAQTMQRYYNASGNVYNPTFTLNANAFTYAGRTFTNWAMGSAGGVGYAAGTNVTLSASTVFYAVWLGVPWKEERPWDYVGYWSVKSNTVCAHSYRMEWVNGDYINFVVTKEAEYEYANYNFTRTYNTQGCKYCRLYAFVGGYSSSINGRVLEQYHSYQYITFDCGSSDLFTIDINMISAGGVTQFMLCSVEFHN